MKFNLDQILERARPSERFEMTYGDVDYRLKRLSVADVTALQNVNQPREGETETQTGQRMLEFARDLFEGDSPSFLHVKLDGMTQDQLNDALPPIVAFLHTLSVWITDRNEQAGNFTARVRQEATSQIAATRATTTTETDSTT